MDFENVYQIKGLKNKLLHFLKFICAVLVKSLDIVAPLIFFCIALPYGCVKAGIKDIDYFHKFAEPSYSLYSFLFIGYCALKQCVKNVVSSRNNEENSYFNSFFNRNK